MVNFLKNCRRGFTLIELLVVLAIISLLMTLAAPRYFASVDKAKETVLVENLRLSRDAIDRFYSDLSRYPESLTELVDRKYLRTLPMDPVTSSNSTWLLIPPEKNVGEGVFNLRSGAPGQSKSGKLFSEL